jgi:hypothetical protein
MKREASWPGRSRAARRDKLRPQICWTILESGADPSCVRSCSQRGEFLEGEVYWDGRMTCR